MTVWRWPLSIAVLTVCGLVSALLGEGGVRWAFCWFALSLPLVVAAACVARSRR